MGVWDGCGISQTMCILLWIDNHAGTSLLDIYIPDTLPDAQKQCQSTEGCTTKHGH